MAGKRKKSGYGYVRDNIEVKISRAKSSKGRRIFVLRLIGRLRSESIYAAEQFLENLERAFAASDKYKVFLMDLAEVEFLDPLGLGTLVLFYKGCRDRGIELVLCGLQPRIKEGLITTKLLQFFRCFETKKEALDILD